MDLIMAFLVKCWNVVAASLAVGMVATEACNDTLKVCIEWQNEPHYYYPAIEYQTLVLKL